MPFCPVCRCEYEQEIDRCIDCNSLLVDQLPPENPDAEPDAILVEVYAAAGDKEAIIIQGLLESEGILCSLSSDIPHTVVPININGLGTVRITVTQDDAERAKEIISSHGTEEAGE